MTTDDNAITKQQIAQFILELADGGEMSAVEQASASTAWAIWDSLKDADVHPDMDEQKADQVLSQFPLGSDEQLDVESPDSTRTDDTGNCWTSPLPQPDDCESCGEKMNLYVNNDGDSTEYCPTCDDVDVENLGNRLEYECRGCGQNRSDCVAHHVSYEPEKVVPMCPDCHGRLHKDDDYLPGLTPFLSRTEAEDRGLVTIRGLDDSWAIE